MNRTNEYRAKAFELLSLAETMNDAERRAETLRFAKMWMSLSEPLPDLRLRVTPRESRLISQHRQSARFGRT
jgi:hypothetical protein